MLSKKGKYTYFNVKISDEQGPFAISWLIAGLIVNKGVGR